MTEDVEGITAKNLGSSVYSFLLDGEPLEDTSVVIPVGEQDEEHIFTSCDRCFMGTPDE